jgi:hypothetical protein
MNINLQRQSIVRAMIRNLKGRCMTPNEDPAFGDGVEPEEHNELRQWDWCIASGLFFPNELSEMQITYSVYGPVWMGLWLDVEVKLNDAGHGYTLFPRWLAEVLNAECDIGIKEEDISDE